VGTDLLLVGGALVCAGVARFIWVDRHAAHAAPAEAAVQVTAAPLPGGGGLSAGGVF
jgi:hypothetical protein